MRGSLVLRVLGDCSERETDRESILPFHTKPTAHVGLLLCKASNGKVFNKIQFFLKVFGSLGYCTSRRGKQSTWVMSVFYRAGITVSLKELHSNTGDFGQPGRLAFFLELMSFCRTVLYEVHLC